MKSRLSQNETTASLRPHRQALVALLVFSAVCNLLLLVPTVYMLQVFDRVMVSRSELTLWAVSLICLYLFGILALVEWSRSRLLARLGAKLDLAWSSQTFRRVYLRHLSARASSTGEHTASRGAFNDLAELRQFVTGTGLITLIDTPWSLVFIGVLFLMHPFLGWLAVAFALVQAIFTRLGHMRVSHPTHNSNRLATQAAHFLQSKLKSTETIEALGMAQRLKHKWLALHDQAQASFASAQSLQHSMGSSSKFIRYMQQSFTLAVGAILVIRGELSPGSMIAANILCARALAPMDALSGIWRSLLSARQAYGRLADMLAQSPSAQALPLVVSKPRDVQGKLDIQNVSVRLPQRPLALLQDIDYLAPAGSLTVVMGPSGSGKSTLARVLLGVWQPSAGQVLLDNTCLTDWPRDEVGPQMGYLPQSIDLFDDTVSANIARLGAVNAHLVVNAAKMTGLHEFILRMPKGYDTPVGEAGHLLSGGMRQRIALARAVYGNPKLVVLDEPNANLDEAGERALMQTLQALKDQGATVFVISHRSNLIELADRLLLLADGLVQASGPKEGVMAALSNNAQRSAS